MSFSTFASYVRIDAASRLFLAVINLIFVGIAAYAWNRARSVPELRAEFVRFMRLGLVFMVAANVVVVSNHLMVSWLALEASTLLAARSRSSASGTVRSSASPRCTAGSRKPTTKRRQP
jgi:formate hydrogenlyase subunit 3/multisubunit Na+/H+ antiporter MnhD subunit